MIQYQFLLNRYLSFYVFNECVRLERSDYSITSNMSATFNLNVYEEI